jgi:trans-aconitate methyltransferase
MKAEPTTDGRGAVVEYPGLHYQPDQNGRHGRFMDAARRFLRAQYGRPSGFVGTIAGKIMARTRSNLERIEWTISLLNIQPKDRVLEIGFGPGISVQQVSRITSEGFVAGVDHSAVMVQQATKRNSRAVREGRVELRHGSVTELPKFDQPFDKIFTINSIHFWPEPVKCLAKLRSRLRPGGTIAVTLQPRSQNATDEITRVIGEEIAAKLAVAGFKECRVEIKKMEPLSVACVLGKN